jgi:N-methylhydantoinase A
MSEPTFPQSPRIRVAVDIGGTFTDLEIVDLRTGRSGSLKTPTVPDDPSAGLMKALLDAAERYNFAIADIALLIHGTTIATNAVLTGKLPAGALITTAGFEDVLEIGRHSRRDIYALRAEPRTLLVPRRHRYGVPERVLASGEVFKALDHGAVDAVADRLREAGIGVVAVSLLNAFANPEHEVAIKDILLRRDPSLFVSLSHEVSPEMREFERTATTVLNALLMPVIREYVSGLERRRTEAGLRAPLYLVQSNGGACTLSKALRAPVNLILSGPSGGVLASEQVATDLGLANVVAVDMGGTSYDISLIQDGRRTIVTQGEIERCPVRVPMVDMRTVGAGGGSIVAVDSTGRLSIGPDSAGSIPGPVCYRRGGTQPTITDANLVLGRLDPDTFLRGEMHLDLHGAREAIGTKIAEPLGISVDGAAEGIIQVANSKLAASVKLAMFERGLDPREFALMSFGGAGGLHATEVAGILGIKTVVFPQDPSTFSALGILMSDIVHEVARPKVLPLRSEAGGQLAALADEMSAEGNARLQADGILPADQKLFLQADLRYRGQAFELLVDVHDAKFPESEIERLIDSFHATHLQRFSFDDRAESVECVTLRLSAVGRLGSVVPAAEKGKRHGKPSRQREVFLDGKFETLSVYAFGSVGETQSLAGPLLVEDDYTTVLLGAGWRISATAGHLVATTRSAAHE